jgi:hypothetical protein
MLFNPWFASNLWLNSFKRMFFAPWIIPLQVAQAVFAGDFTGLSNGIGQRKEPSAEDQRSPPNAETMERSEPRAKALEQLAELVRSHCEGKGGASPADSHHASRGNKPKSRNRAAPSAAPIITQTVHTKSKHKKRSFHRDT